MTVLWFSDAPDAPLAYAYCLVCWSYGEILRRHW